MERKVKKDKSMSNGIQIIENTKKAQDEFGHAWGSDWNKISLVQIVNLIQGKQIAFFDGEYVHFISISEPI